jgi:hypothetical protein
MIKERRPLSVPLYLWLPPAHITVRYLAGEADFENDCNNLVPLISSLRATWVSRFSSNAIEA